VQGKGICAQGSGLRDCRLGFLALPPVLAAAFCFIIPYCASFMNAFAGQVTIRENSAILHITLFTIKQAFFRVIVSLAVGLPGAWFLGTSRSRFNPLFRALTAIPFAMPSILTVLGFVLFFGNSGWVNQLIAAFHGAPLKILYKPEAIILAHGFLNFPLVIRLAGDGLERARRAYAPAAASLGASPFVTALTVILPLTFPALMSALLLAFLYSFTSFGVVLVLGGVSSTTLAVEIYRHARIFLNYPNAGALALIETLIAVLIFLAFVFFGKKSARIHADAERRALEEKSRSIPSLIIMIIYAVFAAIFVLGPIVSILMESFLFRVSRSGADVLSLRWWLTLGISCFPALLRSLILAFFAASLACVLAVFGAGAVKFLEERERGNTLGANFIRFCGTAPVISSGIVLGLGWLSVYGSGFSRLPFALILLHSLIALPFAFNSVSEGFRSLPVNILNAALASGAGPFRALLTTALPCSLQRLRSAWGFAAALSLGELNTVMMLGMEEWETLPLYIYRAAGAYRFGTACAGGTLLILGCAGGLLLSEWGRKKYGA
jgi:thiamine transport system permease protein